MKHLLAISALALAAACASPQKPVNFPVQTEKAEALAKVRAALAERGIETDRVDEEAGIIHTTWVDTGFMYGEVQETTATIVRRYTVIIAPAGAAQNLTLRADAKRCAQDGFEIDDMMVTGACEQMPGLVEPHQNELNALGAHLRSRVN